MRFFYTVQIENLKYAVNIGRFSFFKSSQLSPLRKVDFIFM